MPSASHLHLPGGFVPGAIYELVYTARDPLVLGLGFAAVRDLVSFLRYEEEDGAGNRNPLAAGTGMEKAYGWGRSQSGRFLRDLVYQGFNEDEHGRQVFDAIAPHASGGGRMFLNYEFARPVTSCQQHTNQLEPELFPFAYNVLEDPQTGRRDGILKRPATDPLVVHTQTSTEYWQKRGSLAHTDGRGNDVPLPDRVCMYLIASTQHNAPYGTRAERAGTRHPSNPLSIGPALRALIVAMDRWATDGTAPPPSLIPRSADGTQVAPESLRADFPVIPGVECTGLHNRQLFLDYGDGVARGVIDARPKAPPDGAGYTVLVPRWTPTETRPREYASPGSAFPLPPTRDGTCSPASWPRASWRACWAPPSHFPGREVNVKPAATRACRSKKDTPTPMIISDRCASGSAPWSGPVTCSLKTPTHCRLIACRLTWRRWPQIRVWVDRACRTWSRSIPCTSDPSAFPRSPVCSW